MLLAVLTTFFLVSGTVIFSSVKGAIAVDENLRPLKRKTATKMEASKKGRSRSMVFPDFSKSRNIA